MKKKILALFMAVILTLQLTGCNAGDDRSNTTVESDAKTSIKDLFHSAVGEDSEKPGGDAAEEENTSERDSITDTVEDTDEDDSDDVRYQDDYYEFVNKNLLSKIELAATDAHWDWFGELNAVVSNEMENITEELANDGKTYEKGSSEQKIKDMYECVTNMDNRNETGLGPLKPHMDSIRNASSIEEYVDALAHLSGEFGFSSIVGGYSIMQDKADSSEYAVYMMYADTLIGKEYIEGENTQEYVDLYLDYIKDMFMEFGMTANEAAVSTDSVEGLLRDICASTLTTEQLYDPSLTYNVYTQQDLQKLYTNVDVPKMLKTLRVNGQDKYIVMDVEQAKKINSLLVEENLQALKDYSTFVLLNDTAKYANANYAKLSDDMQNALYGITESWGDEKTWKRLTQELLPWEFGMIYVKEHFSAKDKEEVEKMIEQILEEYETIINRQEWMSEATKKKAVRKLETMQVKIGYPDEWPAARDMMQVTPISEGGSLLSNLLVSMQVSIEDSLSKLGTKVDRAEWDVTPQTINAMYDPLNNEIVFPAAILQAPFYDRNNSYGANMGGIGFVIAHEVSHAFDSTGALYDEYGNYNVWWTDKEMDEYKKMSQSIVDYYNNYEMMGVKVNGDLTLMENIADLGAMTCITSIIGDDAKALDEAFGQMTYNWASEDTASFMMYLLNTDTHSPNKIRVNAVLSSCDAFYRIYDIREGDGMYVAPENRVGIWK
ncbi:MAG: M13 family metallopeptidase [Lachnospiraceae bacterium]|jgi:putative endopeptidase|nr:M13 family metallopeptidase [Lachnospiraceae bacterium]